MAVDTKSIDVDSLRSNLAGLIKVSKAFKTPTVLITISEKHPAEPSILPKIQNIYPNHTQIDHSTINTKEHDRIVKKVEKADNKQLVMAALWTEVCGLLPALSTIEAGYEVYFVTDASGGMIEDTHNRAIIRMIQTAEIPITWMQYTLELQRNWIRKDIYQAVNDIAIEHGSVFGPGILYAGEMFNAQEGIKYTRID